MMTGRKMLLMMVALMMTATLVSAQQKEGEQISVDENGVVTVNYPQNAYCKSVYDAVQQYSRLTGKLTYGDNDVSLIQYTAFLNFVFTLLVEHVARRQ